ncbi:MAG TPA: metal-dependent transcriptional regulator [Anaerovoracaceae bacterium]|nr:metal-dependent transcriptional regulator [Anaerovoracaceae bacterium]
MRIQESGENYLETILILLNKNGSVRSIDVANELDYTKASISRAMGILKRAGYITIDGGGSIHLTELGHQRATQIYERHRLITEYLVKALQISEETAVADACRIEHVISEESFHKIKDWVEAKRRED